MYLGVRHPRVFGKLAVMSPSLWWDDGVAFSWIPSAVARPVRPNGRAYVTVGAYEAAMMVSPMERLVTTLRTTFPQLAVGSQVFPEETHASVIGGALGRSLRFLYGSYGRPTITLSPADRDAYVGTWHTSAEKEIVIAPVGAGDNHRCHQPRTADPLDHPGKHRRALDIGQDLSGQPARRHPGLNHGDDVHGRSQLATK